MKNSSQLTSALAIGSPFIAVAALSYSPVTAGERAPAHSPTTLDEVWSYATLYQNEDNSVIQKFALSGRFHADYSNLHSNQGDYGAFDIRRFRFGFKSQWFDDFTLHVEADIDAENIDFGSDSETYKGLTDAYIAWSANTQFGIKVGKQSAGFTLDGKTSSKKLLTLERSNLANNLWFTTEYFTGASASYKLDKCRYFVGAFSSAAPKEFSQFDAGNFGILSAAYDLTDQTGGKESLLTLDYVYNDPHALNDNRPFQHVSSLNHRYENDVWGLRSEISAAQGYAEQSDIWGLSVMPFYNINGNLQLVTRYTHLSSSDENGLRLNRYENKIESGRGNSNHEGYLGLNWYIHDHKLKLQSGITYTNMYDKANDGGDYDGWALNLGLRTYW
jgi:phosphate-selective porin OprO/OprP